MTHHGLPPSIRGQAAHVNLTTHHATSRPSSSSATGPADDLQSDQLEAELWEALRDVFAPPSAEDLEHAFLEAIQRFPTVGAWTDDQNEHLAVLTSAYVYTYLAGLFEGTFERMSSELFGSSERAISFRLRDVYERRRQRRAAR